MAVENVNLLLSLVEGFTLGLALRLERVEGGLVAAARSLQRSLGAGVGLLSLGEVLRELSAFLLLGGEELLGTHELLLAVFGGESRVFSRRGCVGDCGVGLGELRLEGLVAVTSRAAAGLDTLEDDLSLLGGGFGVLEPTRSGVSLGSESVEALSLLRGGLLVLLGLLLELLDVLLLSLDGVLLVCPRRGVLDELLGELVDLGGGGGHGAAGFGGFLL